jgi:hypothetical protein
MADPSRNRPVFTSEIWESLKREQEDNTTELERRIQSLFRNFYGMSHALWKFPAGAVQLVFAMPLDSLLKRCFGRHLVL